MLSASVTVVFFSLAFEFLPHSSFRTFRNDTAEPWQLCLQFYASGRFKWKSPVVVDEIKPELPVVKSTVDRPKPTISYKMNAQRSYWTDAYGLQADVLKIGRLLKRVDRRDQFYEV